MNGAWIGGGRGWCVVYQLCTNGGRGSGFTSFFIGRTPVQRRPPNNSSNQPRRKFRRRSTFGTQSLPLARRNSPEPLSHKITMTHITNKGSKNGKCTSAAGPASALKGQDWYCAARGHATDRGGTGWLADVSPILKPITTAGYRAIVSVSADFTTRLQRVRSQWLSSECNRHLERHGQVNTSSRSRNHAQSRDRNSDGCPRYLA